MKRKMFVICIVILAVICEIAAASPDDISDHRECVHCGMDRKAYGFSRMLIVYEDGTNVGVCSLHCAVTEIDTRKGRPVKSVLVADRDTRLLIDAEKAIWVMGGKKRGVMTERPKWAFGTKAAAQAFINANGGIIVSWDEALAAARVDAMPKPR